MRRPSSRSTMSVTRIHEDPRVTKPYTEEQWREIDGPRPPDRRPAPGRRRPADDGRRADVRLDRRHATGPSGTRPPSGPTKRLLAGRAARAGSATGSRRGRCSTTGRASGIPASRCRAGRSPATGGATASPVWDDPAPGRRRSRATTATAPEQARRFATDLADRLGVDPSHCHARLRGRLVLPLEGAAAAGQRRPAREQPRRPRGAATAGQGLRAGAGPGRRLRPAAAARATGRRAAVGQRALVPPPRAPVPAPRRLADGLPPAARLAPLGGPRGHASRSSSSTRSPPASPLPTARGAGAPACGSADAGRRAGRGRRGARRATARRARPSRPPGSSARRSASSRATAGSTSSCRRQEHLEDYLDLVAAVEATAADARDAGPDRGLSRRRTTTG